MLRKARRKTRVDRNATYCEIAGMMAVMQRISVVIPTLNAETSLRRFLRCLHTSRFEPDEVIVVDGGSTDDTQKIAHDSGTRLVVTDSGRGLQLASGAAVSTGDWLLFLHADTIPEQDWGAEVMEFVSNTENAMRAAYFRYRLDHPSIVARLLERVVALRCRFLGLPYGDQGLLISRRLFESVGGYPEIPLMEDVAIVRKIGRRRLVALNCHARTSAIRYRRAGFMRRILRNQTCLALYFLGVSPQRIAKFYG